MSILEVDQLAKTFGRRRVVDGVSLNVNAGEIVGLLGPNGAGKTTTFRMICGLLKPDQGRVILAGKDVTGWPMFQRARSGGMGYLPQQTSIFGKLTVQQNLLAMMQLLKFDRKTQKRRCTELLERFKIERLRKSIAGKLSGGEKRRLEIARCLVSNPEIIMLDEPFAGIDPVTVQNIQEVIKELRESGLSILITDHAAREILQITDRTYVVSEGRILCSGSADEIVRHDEVKRKYLGDIEFQNASTGFTSAPAATETRSSNIAPVVATVTESTESAVEAVSDIESVTSQIKDAPATVPFHNVDSDFASDIIDINYDAMPAESVDNPTSDDAPPITPVSFPSMKELEIEPTRGFVSDNDDENGEPTKKRKRSAIRKPRITKIDTFDDIKAPFNSDKLNDIK